MTNQPIPANLSAEETMQSTLEQLGIGIQKLAVIERILKRVVNLEEAQEECDWDNQCYEHFLVGSPNSSCQLFWRTRWEKAVLASQLPTRLLTEVSAQFYGDSFSTVGIRFDCVKKTWESFTGGVPGKLLPDAQKFIDDFPMAMLFEPKYLNQPINDSRAQRAIRLIAVEYKRRVQQAERAARTAQAEAPSP